MPKKAGMEAWKKKDVRNIWRRENSDIIFSVRVSRQSRYTLKDLKDILKIIRFTGIWY